MAGECESPREVFERLADGITNRRWHDLHELYAVDAVIDYPFAVPVLRLAGRDDIQRYFAAVARMPLDLRACNIMVRETSDPEVVVGEYDYDARVTTTGRVFHVANIQVTRVRNGQIVASRDYHNHLVLAEAAGRLPALLEALEQRRG
ncbi:nuclear transport factor 2 family protein [Streptosporangiaceae bacterium NEAU-GS5]|nr:nuclear transport factor 2 family protein [Streptosporangiaceae bacterium NEAU-GS5]